LGDLIFLWSDNGIVTCLRAATGDTVWQKRVGGNYHGSPVCVGGKLYCIREDGEVTVVAAADEFKLLGRNPLGEESRSTPAVADGRMYLRSYSRLVAHPGATFLGRFVVSRSRQGDLAGPHCVPQPNLAALTVLRRRAYTPRWSICRKHRVD
jgi:hypothetical protein